MFATIARALIVVFGAAAVHGGVITLEDTIPVGPPYLQPPVLTGAAPVFGSGGGVVVADAFTPPVSADLYQISVAVDYEDFPTFGVTGTAPMLLTLFTDSSDSPGTPIESWTVPLSPSDTSLTVITVTSVTGALLVAGDQYWLSEVPTDPIHTGIGWGLASSGYPGIELPIAESTTGMNSGWMPTSPNIANEFSVTGTAVPEPGTFGISALIFMSMIAAIRAKSRNSGA
ncbi:MAG TPA: hypothetical protein VGG72_13870 [Bryobacteraceae bacterium]|jgi:hypothetical protein